MGYTTYFDGQVDIVPPLNESEINYLTAFASTRRMNRTKGPYYIQNDNNFGQDRETDIINYNEPPVGQPGLWCQWVPTDEGDAIMWDDGEKFYNSPEWMQYIIDHFLKPGAIASTVNDPQFAEFTFNHVVNGEIFAEGEESSDVWKLVVTDNVVSVKHGRVVYD